jgi:putative ABC transport system ATP-binding protein
VPFLSARENVELGLRFGPARQRRRRSRRLGWPSSLSSGSTGSRWGAPACRSRAHSLASPALLLADEPSARLDEANAVVVGDLLARIVDQSETTVVFSTHDPVLLEVADEVVDLA